MMKKMLSEILRFNDVHVPPLLKLAGHGNEEIFGFPIQVTEDADALWVKLRDLRHVSGYWPVFLGGEEDIRLLKERKKFSTVQGVNSQIQKSTAFNLEGWLEKSALAAFRDFFSFNGHPEKSPCFLEFPFIGVLSDITYLGFIPRRDSFYTPAFLAFGGWNDCPPTHVHCALFRRWNRLFNADVVSLTSTGVCLAVQSPPRDIVTAHAIRAELFMYCPDYMGREIRLDTGYYEEILNKPYWYFDWSYPWNSDIA